MEFRTKLQALATLAAKLAELPDNHPHYPRLIRMVSDLGSEIARDGPPPPVASVPVAGD
jgi:hypothetical protein